MIRVAKSSGRDTETDARRAQVEELLRRCSGGGGKEKGRAAWGLCLLLFSAKASTSPMYSALANQFDGKVAFGEVCGLTWFNNFYYYKAILCVLVINKLKVLAVLTL